MIAVLIISSGVSFIGAVAFMFAWLLSKGEVQLRGMIGGIGLMVLGLAFSFLAYVSDQTGHGKAFEESKPKTSYRIEAQPGPLFF